MKLFPRENYVQPFGLSYMLNDSTFALDSVTGVEYMTGPASEIGFTFAGPIETFRSREEIELTAAARGIPTTYVGGSRGYYSDMKEVQDLVAATNPDSMEI